MRHALTAGVPPRARSQGCDIELAAIRAAPPVALATRTHFSASLAPILQLYHRAALRRARQPLYRTGGSRRRGRGALVLCCQSTGSLRTLWV